MAVRGSSKRSKLFLVLVCLGVASLVVPGVLAGPRDLPNVPKVPQVGGGGSSSSQSGVQCTTVAPAFKTCMADVPFLASTGRLALDLAGLAQRGDVSVSLMRSGQEFPVWECTIPAGSTESCDAELSRDDGAAYRIVARVDEDAIGRWGWSWTPGFA